MEKAWPILLKCYFWKVRKWIWFKWHFLSQTFKTPVPYLAFFGLILFNWTSKPGSHISTSIDLMKYSHHFCFFSSNPAGSRGCESDCHCHRNQGHCHLIRRKLVEEYQPRLQEVTLMVLWWGLDWWCVVKLCWYTFEVFLLYETQKFRHLQWCFLHVAYHLVMFLNKSNVS